MTLSSAPSLWQELGHLEEFHLHVLKLAGEQFGDGDPAMSIFAGAAAQQVARFVELGGGVLGTVGKPQTAPGLTLLPCSVRTARSISQGRTLAQAIWYRLASSRPSITCSSVSSGLTSGWSISLARSRR
jgi:hypothetical protein